jgi:NDP-sugar pyrophosphorylase family protein
MKALLICPSLREDIEVLSRRVPLAVAPMLGASLLEYWLAHLAQAGAKEVFISAEDRPDHIRSVAGSGTRWGLQVQVIPEARELDPPQALLRYEQELGFSSTSGIAVVDHLPGRPNLPCFKSYGTWFSALQAWLPQANTPNRVGMRQRSPGIWVSSSARVSSRAELYSPCWIGDDAWIGPRVVVGPRAVIENEAVIEADAEICYSQVGKATFVGRCVEIHNSLAWGDHLINWQTGSVTHVPDGFVLSSLEEADTAAAYDVASAWDEASDTPQAGANDPATLLARRDRVS